MLDTRARSESDHDERDLERMKESEVGVKERHRIGNLRNSFFVLRAVSTDKDFVDRRRLVSQRVQSKEEEKE
ncbi:hypothetical protein F2Q68_00043326 [Brassica cretica]|uniref:Uncharacterized protein n=2 Tax=Brassica cretica TaxID=69181 RepID=A0A8S9LJS2_BRACR|nr:hypothetical protein F2Q68_00043326 [Brassica cretica]